MERPYHPLEDDGEQYLPFIGILPCQLHLGVERRLSEQTASWIKPFTG
jgi:hypothetical protein